LCAGVPAVWRNQKGNCGFADRLDGDWATCGCGKQCLTNRISIKECMFGGESRG
jgi:hypothetical protein